MEGAYVQITLLIVQLLALILIGIIGYFARDTRQDIKTLFKTINEFRLTVVGEFLQTKTFEAYRAEVREGIHKLRNDAANDRAEIAELKACVARLKERVDK